VAAPDHLRAAVDELTKDAGVNFVISDEPIAGTELYLVYATNHPLPSRYSVSHGTLGFRIPTSFPNGQPEDCFFVHPDSIQLSTSEPTRNSNTIHRTGSDPNFAKGMLDGPVLVFSWHIWDRVPWDRKKHTLIDHYRHALRRFEAPERD
jgi:hypothetical protein